MFNIAYLRSLRLISSATSSSSSLVKHIFSRSSNFSFTFAGYNYMYGHRYLKKYNEVERGLGSAIRDLRKSQSPVNYELIVSLACD